MQNQYTRQAERAIKYAARMARKLKHPYIGTEHLLLGLRSEITGVAGQVLASHGVDEEQLLHLMDELIVPGEEILQQDDPKESPRLRGSQDADHPEHQFAEDPAGCIKCGRGRCKRISGRDSGRRTYQKRRR